MTFGFFSDIHYFNKPYRLCTALRQLKSSDVILIVGDLADRGTKQQFSDVLDILTAEVSKAAVFPVCGNHDLREDDSIYKKFEKTVFERFSSTFSIEMSKTGAYYVRLDNSTDLVGLNPLYRQKLFHFPSQGEQLDFMETHLHDNTARKHIVLCHPPLLFHNPQRTPEMQPYLPQKQDQRLQSIVEEYGNLFFLSGHTHFAPTVERDEIHNVVYINDGSVNPTTAGKDGETQAGNVFFLDTDGTVQCILL